MTHYIWYKNEHYDPVRYQTYLSATVCLLVFQEEVGYDVYDEDTDTADTYYEEEFSWRVEQLVDGEVESVLESNIYFDDFDYAVENFEYEYFTFVIQEEPV